MPTYDQSIDQAIDRLGNCDFLLYIRKAALSLVLEFGRGSA